MKREDVIKILHSYLQWEISHQEREKLTCESIAKEILALQYQESGSENILIKELGKELVLRQKRINDLQLEIKTLKEKLNKKWWIFWKYKT